MGILVSIDNGGTLTDGCAVVDGNIYHTKTLLFLRGYIFIIIFI